MPHRRDDLCPRVWPLQLDKKSGRRCSATYGLERSDRDKGNTMNVSESMLTYRKDE
ncbi:hypothetical protein [Bacillus sp. Hm123]|uniref:hypothetical protein n=1 Tax=Bacillus sp. Hm123 TaxID=3450745 RepID=UPI003F42F49B